jgi:hypothetical protein
LYVCEKKQSKKKKNVELEREKRQSKRRERYATNKKKG